MSEEVRVSNADLLKLMNERVSQLEASLSAPMVATYTSSSGKVHDLMTIKMQRNSSLLRKIIVEILAEVLLKESPSMEDITVNIDKVLEKYKVDVV